MAAGGWCGPPAGWAPSRPFGEGGGGKHQGASISQARVPS